MTIFKTSRVFAQTPAQVFAAFATPERLAQWWGPDGFRNTFELFEFKPGGQWRFTMHGPEGTNYANTCEFVRIAPNEHIELRHTCEPFFTLHITFVPHHGGTLVQWEQAFDDATIAMAVQHIVEPANEQNLTRWQAELT